MLKKALKQILQWFAAIALVFLILNLLCFFYYNPLNGFAMEKAAANICYYPGDTAYDASEGYGVVTADHNGFINRELPLCEDYILVTGSSYTEGHNLLMGLRYTDLLNEKIMAGRDDELAVYNVGHIFNFYPDIISGLDGLFGMFPDPSVLIIEIPSTEYSAEELRASLHQRGYDPEETVDNILQEMSPKQRLILNIKRKLPILRLFNLKRREYQTYCEDKKALEASVQPVSASDEKDAETAGDREELRDAVEDTLQLLRSYYKGRIVILFHPEVCIKEDGTLEMLYGKNTDLYRELCEQEGIVYIDMTERFEEAYREEGIIPNGFWNSDMTGGHMNRYGHAMVADELYQVLMEK